MTIPEINVMVLGQEASGKTIYLAGMYRRLSFDRADSVVMLSSTDDRTRILNQIYGQIISLTDKEFPDSTTWGVDTWTFECSLSAGTGTDLRTYPLVKINYADYSGEMLDTVRVDEEGSVKQKRLDQLIQQADVFIVLIDGLKLLRMMQGDQQYVTWLDQYLSSRLATMSQAARAHGSWQPVHYVITKWDLFDGKFTLDDARARLLAQPSLASNLEGRERWGTGPVRLIPVSVTGRFARLDDEGIIVKVPSEPISPLNVDIPFVAIFPDLIRAAQAKALRQVPATAKLPPEAARLPGQIKWYERVRAGGEAARQPILSLVDRFLDGRGASRNSVGRTKVAVDEALNWLDRVLGQRQEAVQRRLEDVLKSQRARQLQIESRNSAMELAIESFETRLRQFEAEYPASLLTAKAAD